MTFSISPNVLFAACHDVVLTVTRSPASSARRGAIVRAVRRRRVAAPVAPVAWLGRAARRAPVAGLRLPKGDISANRPLSSEIIPMPLEVHEIEGR